MKTLIIAIVAAATMAFTASAAAPCKCSDCGGKCCPCECKAGCC